MIPLNQEAIDIIRAFQRPNQSQGVIFLEVNNPVPLLVASRIGWFMENSLEYYTPWHPINPDYLKVQVTYLSWISLHMNLQIKCVVKAISPEIRNGANRIIQEVFNQFGGSGGVQAGMIDTLTGRSLMGNREEFKTDVRGPPSVDITFTPFDYTTITPEEERMAETMDQIINQLSKIEPTDPHSECGFYERNPDGSTKPGTRWDGRKEKE